MMRLHHTCLPEHRKDLGAPGTGRVRSLGTVTQSMHAQRCPPVAPIPPQCIVSTINGAGPNQIATASNRNLTSASSIGKVAT